MRFLIVMFLCLGLSSCSDSLRNLRQSSAAGNSFNESLARQYLAYAESEAELYNWSNSEYFANKGLSALKNNQVQPEEIDNNNRPIPKTSVPTISEARQLLILSLSNNVKLEQPEAAASAQLFFDCWVDQERKKGKPEQIEICRNAFFETVHELQLSEGTIEKVEEETLIEKTKVKPLKGNTSSYHIRFGTGSTKVNKKGMEVVKSITKELEKIDYYEIVINGHADKTGTAIFNLKLSKKRAVAVKDALIKNSILPERIAIFAFGDTDPIVPTKRGVANPANRRVEIFINE